MTLTPQPPPPPPPLPLSNPHPSPNSLTPNLSTQPSDFLTLNIKISPFPKIPAASLTQDQPSPQNPPPATPDPASILRTLTAVATSNHRLEESQAKQSRLLGKIVKKLDALNGTLMCIHDEFHEEGVEWGERKRMWERVEDCVKEVREMKGEGEEGKGEKGGGEGRVRRMVA